MTRPSVVFFGDGATDSGVFWESINAASLFNLPMLFVCEDNDYAVDSKRSDRQGSKNFIEAVKSFGIKAYEDDSSDVESVYKLTLNAIDYSCTASKPVLLNIKCCRYLEHVGINSDWHWGYRNKDDVENKWISRDAVKTQRDRLLNLNKTENEIKEIEKVIDESIQDSIVKAENAMKPTKDRLFTGVFHEKA